MRAAIFKAVGEPLAIETVDIDRPRGREVLVKTAACGVCHSDLHVVDGFLPLPGPLVLGHEASGIVQEVGPEVSGFKPGDHVIACLTVSCGTCDRCLSGKAHLCYQRGRTQRPKDQPPRLSFQGERLEVFTDIGGFADQMLLHERALVKIAPDVPLDRAALIGCGVVTGVGAVIHTARVEPGTSVAVFGCGGIGLAAIQGARLAGAARIIAVDVFEHKLAAAKRFGATDVVDASAEDPVAAVGGLVKGGVDYAFECIGLKKTAEQAFASIKSGGTATVVGIVPRGQKIEVDAFALTGERKLQGCFMGSTQFQVDAPRYLELYRHGRLNLDDMISRRGCLEDINDAFAAMKAGEVIRTVLMFD